MKIPSLPDLALNRPISVFMLSITFVLLGLISWYRIPLQFLPEIDDPYIGCQIPYPGASPEQVEQQVAIPVEGEFRTISGLRRIRTVSNSDGCFVNMVFDLDTDMTLATAEVRDRMERLKLVLPDEVDRMFIQRFSSRSIPVIAFGMFRAGDQEAFLNLLRTYIEPRIRRIDGVADVQIQSAYREKDVLVEFDQNVLSSMNLALSEVIAILRESSLNLSVGELSEGERKYLVRVLDEHRRLNDIEEIVINPSGLQLREVATVRFATRGDEGYVALDGNEGAFIFVNKESEANTVATCKAVRAEMERILAQPMFDTAEHMVFFDQSEIITNALDNLMNEGMYGAGMALLVLFFFLHRVRPTILVALVIPTSLVVSLVFMFFVNMTLNLISMVSMIIVVGMLVDNAIVVVENIIRNSKLGYNSRESALRGAKEVGLAIFAATTTTWVVFIPMYFMETGRMSVFMAELGLPLMVALAGSLVLALTVVPLSMSYMRMESGGIPGFLSRRLHLKHQSAYASRIKDTDEEETGCEDSGAATTVSTSDERDHEHHWYHFIFRIHLVQWVINGYAALLGNVLRQRLAAMLVLATIIGVTIIIPVRGVGMSDMPRMDTREVKIDVKMDQNYDMEMTKELFALLRDQVDLHREEMGIKNVLSYHAITEGVINIYLFTEDDGAEWKNPKYSTDEVMRILSRRLPRNLPGAELKFALTDAGESGTQGTVSVRLRGDDTQTLSDYAERLKLVMAALPNLDEVETDVERREQEIQLRIDQPLARSAGVTPLAIAQTVDAALRGARLPFMKQGNREVPVWAQFQEENRRSRANLENVLVVGQDGRLIPLNQLVNFEKGRSPNSIHRVNGKNVINVTAQINTEDLGAVQRDLRQAISTFDMPVGYGAELGDELNELSETFISFLTTLTMAIILIYLVMSALFESYLLPLSILTSVPMALAGAVWMLYLTNSQLDTITFIGCILMSGIIVNNGIVIVDHINNLRKTYEDDRLSEAIVQAGIDRFRPVLMTAITTILGLVPLAIATTGGAGTFSGLGRALIGGLSAGTLLTLFVVPVFYSLIDDFHRWFINFMGNITPTRLKQLTRNDNLKNYKMP